MMTRALISLSVLFPLAAQAGFAQGADEGRQGTRTEAVPVVEREVFTYPAAGRRDPFEPLDASEDLGPRFEDLELSGIIYSPEAGNIVVLVDRATGKRYRVWEGDAIGGAKLIGVTPQEAVFLVTVFGVSRQETLRLESQMKEQGG
jgi:hypothetical protein